MSMSAAPITPAAGPILVAGATGALGGRVVRRLLAEGYAVRAVGRNDATLAPLADAGATTVRADLRDAAAITAACEGVAQVVSTANNVMGAGATSPNRVDVPAYRTLCQAMRERRVGRVVHVSALGISADSPVDYFRVKHQVDALLEASGVPYVLVQPSAFMETWVTLLIGDGIRAKQTATLFGDGRRVSNFIAMDDVAAFVCRIVADPTVRNERIHLGGPSTLSYEQVAALLERAMGVTAKRKHVPVPVMRIGSALVRPFNEVAARMMSLGYWSATRDGRCEDWEAAARRFGVTPRTVEAYIAETVGAR